ncbi:MAG: hypothetical protein HY020_07420, partial [Burkholderiales bacterium]|nr:hypothetical protein [Burkholderiales bacterium]
MTIPSLRRACCGGFTLLTLAMAAVQAHAGCDPLNYVLPAPDPAMPRIGNGQTVTNTNPNGCQDGFAIAIDTGGTLVNRGGFTVLPGLRGANGNGGLLILGGTLNNATHATLDNRADFYIGLDPYYGGTLNNGGVIINNALMVSAGTVVIGPFGQISNNASLQLVGIGQSFTNNGLFQNQGSLTMLGIGGSFANHGQIDNAAGAVIDLEASFGVLDWAGGTVNNSGTMRLSDLAIGDASGPNGNYDTFNLLPGSRLETGDLTIRQGVLQVNAGTLRNAGSMGVYGTLINDGDIQTSTLTLDYAGFGLAVLNNRSGGTLTLGSASGVWPGGTATPATSVISGRLFNGSAGTLTIKGDALVVVGAADPFGNLAGYLQNGGTLLVRGRLENKSAMVSTSDMTVLGQFDSSGDFTNTGRLENQGSVNITGNFTHQGDVINQGQFVFAAGSTTQGLGTYRQTEGATWINGLVDLPQIQIDGGALCGSGQLHGTLSIGASGSICPGGGPVVSMLKANTRLSRLADAEPAGLTVSGDLVLSGGRLSFDIGGTAPGSFGSLVIGGHVLGTRGTLQLNFINGYQPAIGSSWALLGSQDADPLSGF